MGPSLHTWDEGTVKTMDWKGRIGSKEGEDSSICWQGHGISFLECMWDNFHWLSSKRKKSQRRVLCELITAFEWWNQEKTAAFGKKKVLFYQANPLVHASVIAMAKINELKFILVPQAPYSSDLAPSHYFLFPNLKKCLGG